MLVEVPSKFQKVEIGVEIESYEDLYGWKQQRQGEDQTPLLFGGVLKLSGVSIDPAMDNLRAAPVFALYRALAA